VDSQLQGHSTPEDLNQFIALFDRLTAVQLKPEMADSIYWRWTADGRALRNFSYVMQFEGSTRFCFKEIIWNSVAPFKCHVFAWLAVPGKCHTVHRLMQKGWPHNVACVLCLSASPPGHLVGHQEDLGEGSQLGSACT
jgi:hypothetical protein